jgi:DNA-binding SARP family transcriptional activator
VPVHRSQASLRTALWRIRQADERLVSTTNGTVRLGKSVQVDLHDCLNVIERVLSGESAEVVIDSLLGDLLPGWEEDWLLLERERIRQLQLHAVEALADQLRRRGQYAEAIDAALTAIAAEPLHESAYAVLIATHLDEGNVAEAHRQFDRYAGMLWTEMRLTPSTDLAARLNDPGTLHRV